MDEFWPKELSQINGRVDKEYFDKLRTYTLLTPLKQQRFYCFRAPEREEYIKTLPAKPEMAGDYLKYYLDQIDIYTNFSSSDC